MNNWNRIGKPIVVLCVICFVITGALAATNSVTAPIIEAAALAAETAARQELIPEASSFTEVTGVTAENVSAVYEADTGGYVITSTGKGYDGDITVMTAFDAEGTILKIKITEQSETKGIGSRVVTLPDGQDFWDQFVGKTAADELTVDGANPNIQKRTGASMSSRGVTSAVNAAIAGFNAIG